MKNLFLLLSFLFSASLFSQQLYWYDVILEVNGEDTVQFEEAVDNYYSSVDFPADVTMTLQSDSIDKFTHFPKHSRSFSRLLVIELSVASLVLYISNPLCFYLESKFYANYSSNNYVFTDINISTLVSIIDTSVISLLESFVFNELTTSS